MDSRNDFLAIFLGRELAEFLDLGDALDSAEEKSEQGLAQGLSQYSQAMKAFHGVGQKAITSPRQLVDDLLVRGIEGKIPQHFLAVHGNLLGTAPFQPFPLEAHLNQVLAPYAGPRTGFV